MLFLNISDQRSWAEDGAAESTTRRDMLRGLIGCLPTAISAVWFSHDTWSRHKANTVYNENSSSFIVEIMMN